MQHTHKISALTTSVWRTKFCNWNWCVYLPFYTFKYAISWDFYMAKFKYINSNDDWEAFRNKRNLLIQYCKKTLTLLRSTSGLGKQYYTIIQLWKWIISRSFYKTEFNHTMEDSHVREIIVLIIREIYVSCPYMWINNFTLQYICISQHVLTLTDLFTKYCNIQDTIKNIFFGIKNASNICSQNYCMLQSKNVFDKIVIASK